MIVVVGIPWAAVGDGDVVPAGSAARAALAAARSGASVQLVGKVGDDDLGDAVVLALARGGVGHVALLRDPGRATPRIEATVRNGDRDVDPLFGDVDAEEGGGVPGVDGPARGVDEQAPDAGGPVLEPADLELALRYLAEARAIVLAEPLPPAVVRAAAEAASYSGAALVVVRDGSQDDEPALPEGTLVLGTGGSDPEGVFAALVGEIGAAIDAGVPPADAFDRALARTGATRPG